MLRPPCPRIHSVRVVEPYALEVEFDNHHWRKYDMAALLVEERFAHLKNGAFFRHVQVEKGGYALIWDDATDLSEYEIWTHGVPTS